MADPALLGTTLPFTWEGQTYHFFDPRDFDLEAEFVSWLVQQAYQAALMVRPVTAPGDYERLLAGISRDYASGVYAWEGEVCFEARKSYPGLRRLAYLHLLRGAHEAMQKGGNGKPIPMPTEAMVHRISKDAAAWNRLADLVWEVHRQPRQAGQQEGKADPLAGAASTAEPATSPASSGR